VAAATSLMVVLIAVTLVVLPLGLPPTVAAVDPSLHVSAWDVAWPLLALLALPLVLGCLARLRWADVAAAGARPLNLIAIVALLLHVNLYFYAEWNAFVSEWGTGSYLAALIAPFVGLGCAYLIVAILRVRNVGTRHAVAISTTVRSISGSILVCTITFGAFPLVSVSQLAFNSWALIVLLVVVLEWRRALAPKGTEAGTPAAARRGQEATMPQQPGGAAFRSASSAGW
jgi:bile acid:Na+ symporter, BASS family